MPSGSCSESTASAAASAEMDIPTSRIPFLTGNCALSRSREISSNAVRPSITPRTDWLRVICWKSANLTFSVTVRLRVPVLSQWPQTLSMMGKSASRAVSKLKRSAENVFSAPTDLRTRLARTGRSSTPRDPIVKGSRLAKVLLKERHRLRFQIETGFNPELVHLRRGRRTDAVEFADRQRLDEGRSHLR